jgi:hypothetical protein
MYLEKQFVLFPDSFFFPPPPLVNPFFIIPSELVDVFSPLFSVVYSITLFQYDKKN